MVIKIWKETFNLLRERPKIILPFLVLGIVNALLLYLLYLTPQRPVAYVLAPLVRTFLGEKFLHYPFNLFILPKLFYYGQLLVYAFVGMLMTAVGVGMVGDAFQGKGSSFLINFIRSFKRYFALLGVWILTFGVTVLFLQIFPKQDKFMNLGIVSASFLLSIFVQILFIYTIPLIIIERRKFFAALKNNFIFLIKVFIPTVLLIILPSLFYLPVLIIKDKMGFLTKQFFPEIVVGVLGLGLLTSFIIDFWVTLSTTVLFVKKEGL